MKTPDYIRLVLTVALLCMVYTETGPFTTVLLTLMSLAFEVLAWKLRRELG